MPGGGLAALVAVVLAWPVSLLFGLAFGGHHACAVGPVYQFRHERLRRHLSGEETP
ncbi:hypothetical protein [Nonomuraea zeae]|uniref:hypothetical protein n=1 Tax=Nonomuraea zeae TaxID=1642303 RepID=UPI0014794D19|nr:hypothetical protein [Nonomuraea zeae]